MREYNFYKLILSGIIFGFLAVSCDTQEVYPDPEISLLNEEGYIFSDTTLKLNEEFKIGLRMSSKSDQQLLHFNTNINRDGQQTSIDTALYEMTFDHVVNGVKSLAQEEIWSFYCRDRDSRKSELINIVIHLAEGSQFGEIIVIDSIWLGAQRNSDHGSFVSLPEGIVYSTEAAYEVQEDIDLAFFYDEASGDMSTIASPGANIDPSFFPGDKGTDNWTVKNTTRFVPANSVGREEFAACRNDSLILANTFDFPSGKRKAKQLSSNMVFSFVTENGLAGLFIVNEVVAGDAGMINFSIKMKVE